MPKTTSGLEILYGLGYDPVDIESDADYIRALKESFNRLQIQNPSDPRLEPLANAVKGYKYAKSKKEAGKSGGKSRAAKRRKGESYDVVKARIDAKEAAKKFISPKSSLNISKLSPTKGGGEGGDLLVIKEKVVSIARLLGDEEEFHKEQAKDAKQEAEKKRRSLKERLLEGSGKIWDGVKKATSTVLKPFQSIWSKIIDFIQTIILGRILFKILEWAGNKENQGKIKSIFKFLEDWWPTLLTAYVLFGTSFTKMAVGLVKVVAWGVVKLLKLIPLLKAALAKLKLGKLLSMIPGGKGKAGLLMKGGMLLGGGMLFNKAMSGDSESETFNEDDIGSTVTPRYYEDMNKDEKGRIDALSESANFNKGGQVPGSGNKDTVPAMLTPGEFVMSKGAVQQYGVDTLAGMNAAAGGTNKPSFMDGKLGYSSGGLVQPVVEAGSINSYQDAIKAGVKVEDSVVGSMRYGSINWTEKIPKGLFGFFGKQRYQIMGTKWTLDGIGKEHNEILAMPTEDFVNIRMGWDGSSSSSTKPKYQQNRDKLRAVRSKSGDPNIGKLSKKKPKVVVVDNPNEEVDASQAQLPSQGNREIPSFDATSIRSPRKMEVLGISI